MQTKNEQSLIGHLDMDAFFAAVEERNNPRFKGLPIAIGADPKNGHGRGVVSTANYKARVYGIKSGMPIRTAWRLASKASPPVLFLPGNFRSYRETSERIMKILEKHLPIVQQCSIDEASFDLTHLKSYAAARKLCQKLQAKIYTKEKVTGSIGIGPNKLIAKMASDYKKPNGLTVIEEGHIQNFLDPLPIRALPGIGPKTEAKLQKHNIATIADVRRTSATTLIDWFGAWGEGLHYKAHGHGSTIFSDPAQAKSIGNQTTLPANTQSPEQIITRLIRLTHKVAGRLHTQGFTSCRTITTTVRFHDFTTHNRSHTSKQPLTTQTAIQHRVLALALPFLDQRENPNHKPIRLVGVRLEKLA